jgi:hypothetical protein
MCGIPFRGTGADLKQQPGQVFILDRIGKNGFAEPSLTAVRKKQAPVAELVYLQPLDLIKNKYN